MKKSLLALAVLGAFAGAASAQTNVTVYGIADVGIQYTKAEMGDVSESLTEMASGIKNGSRIGFRGTEDLGGGLSAIFQLENGFDISNGELASDNTLFNRQAWVGLQGGFGAVKFGRQNTPIHNAVDSIDPFGTGLAGNLLQTQHNGGTRMSNTINYSLPTNLGGFYGEFAYGFGEVAGSTSDGRVLGGSVGYANGPIKAVLSLHKANGATAAAADETTSFLGGTYDFGVAKAHASFGTFKAELPGVEEKTRSYMLGVSAPVGAGSVLASFQREDDRNSDAKADVLAVGYLHSLSKRTSLYTSYGHGKMELPGLPDVKTNQFNVGMQHRF